MDLLSLQELWDNFLAFLDRSFQWLMYLFDSSADKKWPPTDYPNIDDK